MESGFAPSGIYIPAIPTKNRTVPDTHPKSLATMFSSIKVLPTPPPIFYIIALVAFASLTMARYIRPQPKRNTIPQPISTAQSIAQYISRKTSLSHPNPPHNPESSGPLLPLLPLRQATIPSLDTTYTTHLTSTDMQASLSTHIHSLASLHPRSTYLGHPTFSIPSSPSLYGRHKRPSHTLYLGLICHLDPPTGILSVRLHPSDIHNVVHAGWGRPTTSPDEATLPTARDEHDLAVQQQILNAAVGYVCKGAVEEGEEDILQEGTDNLIRPQWLLPRYML